MKPIPTTYEALVLRTDFSDDAAWEAICAAIEEPQEDYEFKAYVDFLSDTVYDGLTVPQLLSLLPQNYNHTFMFIVDRTTLSHPERPIVVVDLHTEIARTFRVIPSQMWGVENNLSVANMFFSEFADVADQGDGIFRDFE